MEPFTIRKTDYQVGDKLQIIDTYFHPFTLGETVEVFSKDLHSYQVKNNKSYPHCQFIWVKENQVVPDGGWVEFEADFGIKAKYRFDENGETILKIVSKCGKVQYYSVFNQVGEFFDENILPIINRKHPSQLIKS